MTSAKAQVARFDANQYGQSQAHLRMLKSRLPESAVETLAREVLRRFTDREREIGAYAAHAEDIEALCHALLSEDDNAGAQFIADLRLDGATIEATYVTYLAGAARMMGDWWSEDRIPFTSTILGTTRMYAIMRALTHQFPTSYSATTRMATFVSVPGETHVLGIRMAADLFRNKGWEIDLLTHKSHDELVDIIAASEAAIVGISAAGAQSVEPLSRLVVALRISNPRVRIFLGGNIVDEAKHDVALLCLDGVMTNVDDAIAAMSVFSDFANA